MLNHVIASIKGFDTCWGQCPPPPKDLFEATLEEKLGPLIRETPSDWQLHLAPESSSSSTGRARLDGVITIGTRKCNVYAYLVWVPARNMLRGTAHLSEVLGEPEKVSLTQFVELLRAIDDECDDLILEGQIYDAYRRVDSESPEFRSTFPEIFRLFERFQDDEFGNPGILIGLLEEHGGFEEELLLSLERQPSIHGLVLVNRLLCRRIRRARKSIWIDLVRKCTRHPNITSYCTEFANEILDRHT